MAVAALVLSIVAILLPAASARHTRQQARQARRVADIESDRREVELEEQRQADLARKRARLRLHLRREENRDGNIADGTFRHALVVTNDGPADAPDVKVEIVSAWENQLGTRACFADSAQRRHTVGRVPAYLRSVLPLKDDSSVHFGDVGECDIWWRDDSSADLQYARKPARPDWL